MATPVPVTPPPTPTPVRPTPVPAVPVTVAGGRMAKVTTPGDCLYLRTEPRVDAAPRMCAADQMHVQVLDEGVAPNGDVWARVRPWGLDAAGWVRAQFLADSPDCERLRTEAACDTAAPVRTTLPAIDAQWTFITFVRYGPRLGQSLTQPVAVRRQGEQVIGTGAFAFEGQLTGRLMRGRFRQGQSTGDLTLTFTADGLAVDGIFTDVTGSGGTLVGVREGLRRIATEQASLLAAGPGAAGGEIYENEDYFLCYTVSRPARVLLRDLTTNAVLSEADDDGAGDCRGPYRLNRATAPVDGRAQYRVEVRSGGALVAHATLVLTVVERRP